MTGTRPSTDHTPFGSLRLETHPELLAPRDWTTAQSEWTRDLLRAAPLGPVLELCAGLGHIGLYALRDRARQLVSVDREPVAAELIRRNAVAAGMGRRVETRCGPVDAVLEENERFAMVIADPPWVPEQETERYPEDPVHAIDGGPDGLAVARQCLDVIARHLLPGGYAVLQLGNRAQAAALRLPTPLREKEIREFPRGVLVALTREAVWAEG